MTRLTVVVVLALCATARADDGLTNARRALDKLDYPKAGTALAGALESGAYGHDDLVEIYRMSGLVAATLGDRAAAVAAFERMLALDPKATLATGTSPKIARVFADATAYYTTHHPLEVTTETATAPPAVAIVVVSDPLKLVSGARAIVVADGKPEETRTATGSDRMAIALPAGKRLELRIAVLDARGNRLVELGSASAPMVIERAGEPAVVVKPPPPVVVAPPPVAPSHARPLYARWWLWGSVSVAFAAGGTLFGMAARSAGHDLDTLNANSRDHDFTEAQAALSRGQRDALLSNLGFGAAAATAIVAAVLFARGDEHSIPIAPVAVRGGGGVMLEVPF